MATLASPARPRDKELESVREKVLAGHRLGFEDGIALYKTHDLLGLGQLANHVREERHGDAAYFVWDTHINHTNVCVATCDFCAFAATKDDPRAYTMALDDVFRNVSALSRSVREVHIVGGLHPELPFAYFTDMLKGIKAVGPDIDIKAFTAVEVFFFQRLYRMSVEQVLAIGNGFFKPSMSTLVGRLYPEGSPLKDSGYSIFYMGINVRRLHLQLRRRDPAEPVRVVLRLRGGRDRDVPRGGYLPRRAEVARRRRRPGRRLRGSHQGALLNLTVQVLVPAAIAGFLGYTFLGPYLGGAQTAAFVTATIPVVLYYVVLWAMAPREEKGPIGVLAMAGVVVIFWMVFHQNGSSLTYWAEENTRREAGALAPTLRAVYMDQDATIGETIADPDAQGSYWRTVPVPDRPVAGEKATLFSTEIFQSVNPWFVVVLTPLVVGLLAWLRQRRKEPSTPGKIAWGMMITAASTLFMIAAVLITTGGQFKASATWLIASYPAAITLETWPGQAIDGTIASMTLLKKLYVTALSAPDNGPE